MSNEMWDGKITVVDEWCPHNLFKRENSGDIGEQLMASASEDIARWELLYQILHSDDAFVIFGNITVILALIQTKAAKDLLKQIKELSE